jgi:hypothetical protein
MKKFLYTLIGVLSIVILSLYVLDYTYTTVYERSNPRNKFQFILKMKPQTIEYVFLGSSRVANHIATKEVEKITHKKVVNLGMEGAHLDDNLLQLKLLLHNGVEIEKLFLQVDYQFDDKGKSPIALSDAMPFIKNPVIRKHLEETNTPNFEASCYVPFYRYMNAEPKIGFREFVFSLLNKAPKINPAEGFTPKQGNNPFGNYALPDKIANENEAINQIKKLCRENKIKLILFCAPFCSVTKNRDYITKLKQKLPELRDYSKGYEDSFFYDCAHLNENGALLFTRQLILDERDEQQQ